MWVVVNYEDEWVNTGICMICVYIYTHIVWLDGFFQYFVLTGLAEGGVISLTCPPVS